MGKIEKNLRDVSRIIKISIFEIMMFVSAQIYFNKAFSYGGDIIKTGLSEKTKGLGLNLSVGNELVGDQANKFIVFIIIMTVILIGTSVYTSLTYDRFSFVAINILISSFGYLSMIYKPVISNKIEIESNFLIPIILLPVLANIGIVLVFRFFGYCIDILIFGTKLKKVRNNPKDFVEYNENKENINYSKEYNTDNIEFENEGYKYENDSMYTDEYVTDSTESYNTYSWEDTKVAENAKKNTLVKDYYKNSGQNRVSIIPGRR